MKIRSVDYQEPLASGDLLVAFSFEGSTPNLGKAHAGVMRAVKATGDIPTKLRLVRVFHPPGGPKRLGLIGMGKRDAIDIEMLRRAGAVIQGRSEALEVGTFQVLIDAKDHKGVDAFMAGKALAEGVVLGAYRYVPPRKEKPKARKGQRAEFIYRGKQAAEFKKGVKQGRIAGEATVFARDVENMPGNLATPTYLAKQARTFGQKGSGVKVKVFEEKDMERLGMRAILGVSRGSVEPAKLIIMDYNPKGAEQTICVVGKGLTFDSGGISLKPGARMDEMRFDMCGGGTVLGLFHAIANGGMQGSKKKVRVVGVVVSSENMPDAKAQKPGDVVAAYDGTTIEILNTDAEGRLILADALAYATKTFKPDQIVDLATLTGAVVVALGHEVAAVMGNDDDLIDELIDAGKSTDEQLWELPLWEVHREQIKSKCADIANLNSPSHGNGCISGGAFLSYFIGDTPWAHMDIAGTAYGARAKDYHRTGAVGTMVRMLLHWLRSK